MSLASELLADVTSRFIHKTPSDVANEARTTISEILGKAAKAALEVAVDVAPYGREAEEALKLLEAADDWFRKHVSRNEVASSAPIETSAPAAPVDVAPVADVPVEPVAPVAEPVPVDVAPVEAVAPVEPAPAEQVAPVASAEVAPVPEAPAVDPAVAAVVADPAQSSVAPSPFTEPAPVEVAQPADTVQAAPDAPVQVAPAAAPVELFTYTGDPAAVANLAEWPKASVVGANGETLFTHATSDAIDTAAWVAYTGPTQAPAVPPVA